jgi:hypothetical protein
VLVAVGWQKAVLVSSCLTEETKADIPPHCHYTFMWRCITDVTDIADVTDTCCKWFTADSIPPPHPKNVKTVKV